MSGWPAGRALAELERRLPATPATPRHRPARPPGAPSAGKLLLRRERGPAGPSGTRSSAGAVEASTSWSTTGPLAPLRPCVLHGGARHLGPAPPGRGRPRRDPPDRPGSSPSRPAAAAPHGGAARVPARLRPSSPGGGRHPRGAPASPDATPRLARLFAPSRPAPRAILQRAATCSGPYGLLRHSAPPRRSLDGPAGAYAAVGARSGRLPARVRAASPPPPRAAAGAARGVRRLACSSLCLRPWPGAASLLSHLLSFPPRGLAARVRAPWSPGCSSWRPTRRARLAACSARGSGTACARAWPLPPPRPSRTSRSPRCDLQRSTRRPTNPPAGCAAPSHLDLQAEWRPAAPGCGCRGLTDGGRVCPCATA